MVRGRKGRKEYTMIRVSATEGRKDFADLLNKVNYGGERIVFHRRGKNIAALISIEDLELIEAIEDNLDLEAIKQVLNLPGTLPQE